MPRPKGKLKTTKTGPLIPGQFKNNKKSMNKFIIIDGVKYAIDPADETKALLDAEEKQIPYVEPKVDPIDLSKVSLEDLKKANPDVAKALQEMEDLKVAKTNSDKEKDDADTKAKQDAGKWQELAEDEKTKRLTAEASLIKSNELLANHQETIKGILESTMKDIPEDKRGLIPADYSPRKKLEYITQNSKILGISISPANKGGKIEANGADLNLDDESKVTAEYDVLLKKGATRTPIETQTMIELSRKVKEIRLANSIKK